MEQKDFDLLVEKVGKEATEKLKSTVSQIEETLEKKQSEMLRGLISQEDFASAKKEQETKLAEISAQLSEIKDASVEQGKKLNAVIERAKPGEQKTLADFIKDNAEKIKQVYKNKVGHLEFTTEDLKAAGVTSIGGSIQAMDNAPDSPYAPGLAGSPLEIFGLVHNPNFVMNRVSMGRTNSYRHAWIDETVMEGAVGTNLGESDLKPLVEHRFKVQLSEAKKAAAHMILTEEFAEDVPSLYDDVRNLLRADVLRAFDDQLQVGMQAAARPYNITGLNNVQDANLWDALLALVTQVGYYNFQPNTIALNWITDALLKTQKNINGTYLTPSFMEDFNQMLVRANKITTGHALVGDFSQYQVKIYKDLVIRIGWINENFIHNEFAMVAEIRYHDYISENRRNALAYDKLSDVQNIIASAASSS